MPVRSPEIGAVAGERRIRIREIWRAYHDCSITKRFHLVGRYLLCPYDFLLSLFPPAGQILDIGCGDGLLLFLLSNQSNSRGRTYLGIDVGENRIADAKRAKIPFAEFRLEDVSTLPADTFECVAIVDVLYLLPIGRWTEILQQAVRILRKNGLLIVKEVTNKPRWKYWISYFQEILAIKVIGMTQGDAPHLESTDTYRAYIEAAGIDVFKVERLDAWRPHAHVAFVGRKGG
jgi:2-polyprenyl-3-methyl-5-hydroxy-6-metoxy-1,4-benzoquinol methylase